MGMNVYLSEERLRYHPAKIPDNGFVALLGY